jgi:hypothetical protein
MIIKRVRRLNICLEVECRRSGGGERSVGDGEGDFERLVDLDLWGAVVGDFARGIDYVRPFPTVCRAFCEAV